MENTKNMEYLEICMRKLKIIEIENSFLNFFTPAVIVAAAYFFFNFIMWPIVYLEITIMDLDPEINYEMLDLLLSSFGYLLICVFFYYIIIPRLKTRDAEFKKLNRNSFVLSGLLFCVAILIYMILTWIFPLSGLEVVEDPPTGVTTFEEFINPIYLVLFTLSLVSIAIFVEIIYRRTIIPLLEDRGLSPVYAVLLSALGQCFIDFPVYVIKYLYHPQENLLSVILWGFSLNLVYGIFAGAIYVLARNIIFPILFFLGWQFHYLVAFLGVTLENQFFLIVYFLLNIISIIVGLTTIVYVIYRLLDTKYSSDWVEILKKHSSSNIKRGVTGFFIISLGLFALQVVFIILIRFLTNFPTDWGNLPNYILVVTPFYLLIFTIPFWLTISTEYAQD